MTKLFEVKSATKIFGGGLFNRNETVALKSIDFELNGKSSKSNADLTAIAGESGSGKTTLARLLLGIAAPTTGTVEYDGKDLSTISRLSLIHI